MSDLTDDFLKSLEDYREDNDDIVQNIKDILGESNGKADARAIAKLTALANRLEAIEKAAGMDKWFVDPSIDELPKHKTFFGATKDYNEVAFIAANRGGKTVAGGYSMASFLTGIYPSWWNGRVFDHPIDAWVVGKDARSVRDTLQKELLGPVGEWGTGMLPAHTLGRHYALQGTPQAIDIIKVKSKYGGWSELGFKNAQQDIGAFMGTSRDVVWGDEELPLMIYNECNIRTATVNGLMMLTFTPLHGLTELIINFCKNADYLTSERPIVAMDQEDEQTVGAKKRKAVIQVTWDDVPWLTEETKARLLEDTPLHLRDARSKGTPSQSAGNVYQTPLDNVVVEPFTIPESWPRMYALDVGWQRTAAVWGALDPATDTLYFYSEHYMGQELPAVHAHSIRSRGDWMHGVIDPASHGRSQLDGKNLISAYKDLGLNLREANNEVESGIMILDQRFAIGKAKIFKTMPNLMREYQLYRRDRNGKIVKENDHALDAIRYIVNNMKFMSSKLDDQPITGAHYAGTKYDI